MKSLVRAAACPAISLALAASPTMAQPPPAKAPEPAAEAPDGEAALNACFRSFGAAQKLRRQGELLQCRQELLLCGRPPCPEAIVDKCSGWLREVDQALPTVLVTASDNRGMDTVEVEVIIDGEVRAQRLDGLPIALDPGPHTFRFVARAGEVVEQQVLLTVGEKNRRLEVKFAPADKPLPPVVAQPPVVGPDRVGPPFLSPLLFIGFGLGAVGIAAGTATGIMALSRAGDLADRCPDMTCTSEQLEDYDDGAALAHVSTLSFIVAGGGLVLGAVGLLTSRFSSGADGNGEGRELSMAFGLGSVQLRGQL